jgi:hypothetical protein
VRICPEGVLGRSCRQSLEEGERRMGFWDKVVEFFKEDDSWMHKEPREFQGKIFTAWDEKADKWAAWPNAPCAKCTGIGLKKELYWNRETDIWYHPDCMTG